jgi:hypothetical protein
LPGSALNLQPTLLLLIISNNQAMHVSAFSSLITTSQEKPANAKSSCISSAMTATSNSHSMSSSGLLSPKQLLIFRTLILCWHAPVWFYQSWIFYCEDGDPIFVTFTHLCYMLFLIYFSVAITAHFHPEKSWLVRLAPPTFSVCLTFQLGSTLIYWPILFRPEHNFLLTFHSHFLNLVSMITELSVNSLSMPWQHMKWAILVGLCYFPVGWIFYYVTGRWVYFFLDVFARYAALWYIGLILVFTACFVLGKGLVGLSGKSRLLNKKTA